MQLGVLGPLKVHTSHGAVNVVGARQRRLLAALIAHGGRAVSADRLIDIVFEGDPPPGAATTIRSYVARLRRSLAEAEPQAGSLIVTDASGYLLRIAGCDIDADRFVAMTESGRRQLDEGDAITALAALRSGLELWRGGAYEEFADDEWARPEILRLEELRALAAETLIDAQLECGLNDEVVPDLRRLTDQHPLRDRFRAQLALALYRAGRQAEALRSLNDYRKTLADVGLEPSDEMGTLERNIASHDPALRLTTPAGRPLRGYRLAEMLRKGPHGFVCRAIQPGSGREVAVKAIPADLADNPDFIRRFDTQAQLVSRLEHPHIVPLYDYWREPGGAYLVSRLLPTDLSERLGAGPLEVEEVLRLAQQVGAALMAAHRAGVIHGDITPSKVRVHDSHAYLSGLGLASVLFGLERDHMPAGPSGYESPQRIAGEPPGPADDQFSLAVLLAHTLSGVLPFGRRGMISPHDKLSSVHAHRPAVPAAVDEVLWKATSWNPQDRYSDAGVFIEEFIAALVGKPRPAPPDVSVANPYRGLSAFTEVDSAVFFGRDAVVEELLRRLAGGRRAGRFVVVVGASGSGKSSIVRAGVVPRLRAGAVPGAQDWHIATMVPGPRPFARLVAALQPIAAREPVPFPDGPGDEMSVERSIRAAIPPGWPMLLVIDQLEELFTAVSDESVRMAFIEGLVRVVNVPNWNVRVVATLRADYYDRPLHYHRFGDLVRAGTVTVVGMTATQLEEAITEPAARSGVEVEPACATQIVADVLDQPASLPLLQFTLTELFERRQGRVMSLASYRELGGVEAAVARRADQVLQRVSPADRELARGMFLRLLSVDESGKATRRRVLRSELLSLVTNPAGLERIIDLFGEARLLSFDHDPATRGPTVEVAHEALIAHWPRLGRWVTEAGMGLRIQGHLTETATSWDREGRDPSDLYRGERLESALEWTGDQPDAASSLEREFLASSVQLREAEARAERERLEQHRRANRRLRILLGGVGIALTVALIAGFLAVKQWRAAQREARQETVRQLVASSAVALEEDPELAILLALEATEVSRRAGETARPEAVAALHEAVQTSRLELRLGEGTGSVEVSPDGTLMAAGVLDRETESPSNEVVVWDATTGERQMTLVGDGPVVDLAFNPGGRVLMAGYSVSRADDHIVLWDPTTGRPLSRLPRALGGNWNPNGELLAAVEATGPDAFAATVWQVDEAGSGTELSSFPIGPLAGLTFVDETTLAVGDLEQERVVLYDALTGEETGHLETPGFVPTRLRLDATQNRLVAGGELDAPVVRAWDLDTGSLVWSTPVPDALVEVSPETGTVASFGRDGQVRLHDPGDGAVVASLEGHTGTIDDVAFYPEGARLASTIEVGSGGELLDLGERLISGAVFSPGGAFEPGRHLAVIIDAAQVVEVYDMVNGDLVASTVDLPGHDPIALAFDPTGRYLAMGTQDGRASVLDLRQVADGAAVREALRFDRIVDSGGVAGVSLNAEGVLATSGFNSLRLWAIHSGRLLNELSVEIDTPPFAAFSPKGDYVFYTDGHPDTGYVLRSLPFDTDKLTEMAASRVTRGFTDDECQRYELTGCG